MTKHRISTTVTTTVVLGGSSYAETLTITSTGMVTPLAAGTDGIIGRQSSDEVINHGSIVAATGTGEGDGGVGIDLTAGGTIINRGSISGGMPAYGANPVLGGNGVNIHGGSITNSGTIQGGSLGGGDNFDSQGGTGVHAFAAPVTIMNSGLITGGYGTRGYRNYGDNTGGVGVDLGAGGMLSNSGTIKGGYAGYGRGVAVELTQHSTLVNHGTIFGGNEQAGGAVTSVNSQMTNDGTIQGFGGYYYARGGAFGVEITGGSLTNNGEIAGGRGNALDHYQYEPPGAGLDATGATITNAGTIAGGPGNGGAVGVSLADHASLANTGLLIGGNAFFNYDGNGYTGGIGLSLAAGTSATNAGIIQGGLGGGYSGNYVSTGGAGGAGVSLSAGSMLTNSGTLIGGAGGNGSRYGGTGGDGVDINGGTLTTSGTIIGGAGGMSPNGDAKPGDAVDFGARSATLVVDPGAVFEGAIAGNDSVNDTLVLAGTAFGTLSGFGSTISGITTISETAGAEWTLQGAITGSGELDIGKHAQLTLTGGSVSIATIAFDAGGHGTLTLGSPASVTSTFSGFGKGDRIDLASVQGTSLSYANGTLSVLGANGAVVATLDFAGDYSLADFKLHADGGNTDILYAGGLPDFAPLALEVQPVGEHSPLELGGGGWRETGEGLAHLLALHR